MKEKTESRKKRRGKKASFFSQTPLAFGRLKKVMGQGLIAFSMDGEITFLNKGICDILGIKNVEALLKRKLCTLIYEDAVRMIEKQVESRIRRGLTFETKLVHTKGHAVSVFVTQIPLFDLADKLQSYFWVVTDQTEVKKNESLLKEQMWALEKANAELRKLDKIQSDFLSMVSHELRTPLSSIKEGVSLVLDEITGPISEKQKNFLTMVKRNIDRLANLINDLLDLSKMESGKMEIFRGNTDINELAKEGKWGYENLAVNKNIDIHLDLTDRLPEVIIDRDKTSSVFANLLSNALKFTESGGEVTLKTCRYEKDPNFVLVSVSDTGMGIAKKNIKKLFTKFRQLEDTTTRKVGGTGLGLAICKEIVQLQGGHIWAESEEKKGSTFSFTLPIAGGNPEKKKSVDHR